MALVATKALLTKHDGFIFMGESLLSESMTLPEAKLKAWTLPGCKGFSFQGTEDQFGPNIKRKMYFRNAFETQVRADQPWTSFRLEKSVPELIQVTSPTHHSLMSGAYKLVPGRLVNRCPVWVHISDPEKELYYGANGGWFVAFGNAAKDGCSRGVLATDLVRLDPVPVLGKGAWKYADAKGCLVPDEAIMLQPAESAAIEVCEGGQEHLSGLTGPEARKARKAKADAREREKEQAKHTKFLQRLVEKRQKEAQEADGSLELVAEAVPERKSEISDDEGMTMDASVSLGEVELKPEEKQQAEELARSVFKAQKGTEGERARAERTFRKALQSSLRLKDAVYQELKRLQADDALAQALQQMASPSSSPIPEDDENMQIALRPEDLVCPICEGSGKVLETMICLKCNGTGKRSTIGATVEVDGRSGKVAWDGRPSYNCVTIRWEDGNLSEPIPCSQVVGLPASVPLEVGENKEQEESDQERWRKHRERKKKKDSSDSPETKRRKLKQRMDAAMKINIGYQLSQGHKALGPEAGKRVCTRFFKDKCSGPQECGLPHPKDLQQAKEWLASFQTRMCQLGEKCNEPECVYSHPHRPLFQPSWNAFLKGRNV